MSTETLPSSVYLIALFMMLSIICRILISSPKSREGMVSLTVKSVTMHEASDSNRTDTVRTDSTRQNAFRRVYPLFFIL